MTTVAVLIDPPRPGLVFPQLVESSPVSAETAAGLYAALCKDIVAAVEASGGDLLVNYRPEDALDVAGTEPAEAAVRAVVGDVLDPATTRFEVQVGETFAGRAGNTATHLLEQEGVDSVAIVEPTAALIGRTQIDAAAMKLRRSDVVLGPAPGGRVYYAAFADPIDFADAYAPPAIETLTRRARDRGLTVDFLEQLPIVETGRDLAGVLAMVRARRRADRLVPQHLTAWLDDAGLGLAADDEGLQLVAEPDG